MRNKFCDAFPAKKQKSVLTSYLTKDDIKEMADEEFFKNVLCFITNSEKYIQEFKDYK